MTNTLLKSAVFTLPLITACGGHNLSSQSSEIPKEITLPPLEEPPGEPTGLALTQLGNMILTYSFTRMILSHDDYDELVESRTALVIKGKLRLYIPFEELADHGIYSVDDAIQDGGWIEKFDRAKVAEDIRQIAYANNLIDRDDLQSFRRDRMVPIFRGWVRMNIHENDLLQNWIVDAPSAFEGGIMQKRTDEELKSYKETAEDY